MKLAAPGRVELRIPRRAEFVRLARMTACTLAAQLDFTYDVMKDIELAVAEACTNAVEHVADESCDEVLVRFIVDGQQLVVEVVDRGQGFDPAAADEGAVGEGRIGGLGLLVIREVMDGVDITCDPETGTCVRMIKHRTRV
jgi:serine/threonine-protein kinase RsbW